MRKRSEALFDSAIRVIPGGVSSPVRAAKAVDVTPPFISEAQGCYLEDVDGNRYIDYVSSWGPMILGHAHPDVFKAIESSLKRGTSYGAPTEAELEMTQTIVEMVPSVEMVRMVNSGTEATMSAIRLARGYTGREKIIKFDGCYHGHVDSLLVSAGSGVATLGIPGSPGVPLDLARLTLSLPFNDPDEVSAAFEKYGDEIAAIILEPIPGNMGVITPDTDFIRGLREITSYYGALLIFDEVITGFRVGPGGAQEYFNVMPDLTCMGKIIGGGLPVGAFGGKKEIMSMLAPEGDIYQAGTLSGNPLAMKAGLATLRILKEGDVYASLDKKGELFFSGLESIANAAGIDVAINRIGSMGTMFFSSGPVRNFTDAKACDQQRFKTFYRAMLDQGIYLAPSPFEASFLSMAHTDNDIEETLRCAENSFDKLL